MIIMLYRSQYSKITYIQRTKKVDLLFYAVNPDIFNYDSLLFYVGNPETFNDDNNVELLFNIV